MAVGIVGVLSGGVCLIGSSIAFSQAVKQTNIAMAMK
jgi:hypothetical protein